MRDLKHRVFFERLLSDAKNELVDEALAQGQLALGYSCYYVPEVLMNLSGCFSVRLRAPGITDTSIATYYMSEKTCMYSRSILERAIEGGFNFFAALLSTETCGMMHRAHEHFEMLNLVKEYNEKHAEINIKCSISFANSTEDKTYDVRALIRCAFKKLV